MALNITDTYGRPFAEALRKNLGALPELARPSIAIKNVSNTAVALLKYTDKEHASWYTSHWMQPTRLTSTDKH